MKLGIVVPRYGPDLSGGPEHQCRLIAERLAAQHQVDVLTTCAADRRTWANVHPEGSDRLRGVTVRRFATTRMTDPAAVRRSADRVFFGRHQRQDEMDWLKEHGPWAPALTDHLERQHAQYDVLIFFTCLHAPAVLGVRLAPSKSVVVPVVQDGPELELGVFEELFTSAAAFAWESDDERRLVSSRFHLRSLVDDVVGCGVDLPEGDAAVDGGEWLVGPPDREPLPPHLDGPANTFRRRHRLYGPFVLNAGRITSGQGCEELLEYFQHYVHEGGQAKLVLMGSKLMPLLEDSGVRFAGMLPDEERLHSLQAATVVVAPSPDDSQIMLVLEALSVGTPVLVNARAATTVQHCRRSQAGLFYGDRWEFADALKLMVRDADLRSALGRNGRAYVSHQHRWATVLAKYERLFDRLRGPARNGRHEVPDTPPPQASRGRERASDPGRDRDRDRSRRPRDRAAFDRSRHRRRDRR
jgi:glycosyltransferase involved in cell wall biosynthesis